MSYCRYGYDSDVYVIDHTDGYISIRVAAQRTTVSEEELENLSPIQMMSVFAPIGLPHDEELFEVDTQAEAIEKLLYLQSVGYNVPEYGLKNLRENTNLNSPPELTMKNHTLTVREALLTVLDQVDYDAGACGLTDMVGACLPIEVIRLARQALKDNPE